MEGRKQFTFYRSYYQAIKALSARRRLGVLEAIIAYGLDGIEPEGLDDVQTMAFTLMQPTLDAGRKKAMCGKLGGSKTKANRKQTESKKEIENEIENENENEIEIEIENEIETENDCGSGGGFAAFWDLYPVKIAGEAARNAWEQLRPSEQAVLEGVRRWKRSEQWSRENGRFIPRAAKFLLEKQYLDHPPQVIPKGASGELGQAELEAIRKILQEA